VVSRVVVWIREFLVRRSYTKGKCRRGKEVKVTSGVPQGSVSVPLLFLVYVNDIYRNMHSSFRLFADDCIIYRKITHRNDIEKIAEGSGHLGRMGGGKWDENKSQSK